VFVFESTEAVVSRLEIRSTVKTDGKDVFNARLHLELPKLDSSLLPFLSAAVQSILDDSRAIEDGPNSVSVSVKREFPLLSYSLAKGKKQIASFVGQVKNRPKVSIVEGSLSLSWTVDVDQLSESDLRAIAKTIAQDGYELRTTDPQLPLPLE
jgi:hypothetical protein